MSSEVPKIILRNGPAEAVVDPIGARISSFQVNGVDIVTSTGIEFSFPHTGPFPSPLSHLNGFVRKKLWIPIGPYPEGVDSRGAAFILDSEFYRLNRQEEWDRYNFRLRSLINLDPNGLSLSVQVKNTGHNHLPTQPGFKIGLVVEDKTALVTNLSVMDNREKQPGWLNWEENQAFSLFNHPSWWVRFNDRLIDFSSDSDKLRNVLIRSQIEDPSIIFEMVEYFPTRDFYHTPTLATDDIPIGGIRDYRLRIIANVK